MIDFFLIQLIIGILLFLFIGTFLLKKIFKAETYAVISIVKSSKIVKVFDKFLFLGKALDIFAELGLILGFGVIAIDFNYARKKSILKRIVIDFISFVLLFLLFYFSFGRMLFLNPQTKNFVEFFSFVFALTGISGFILFSLVLNAYDILLKLLLGKKACAGVAPLIPGVKVPGVPIFVPLHGWISLLIILVLHEGFHGILARRENFTVKSAGLLFLGLLPLGAFVDPEEKQLAKAKPIKTLRVLAAGATANIFSAIVFAFIAFLLFGFVLAPMINSLTATKNLAVESVVISKVNKNISFCGDVYASSAYNVIDVNSVLLEINNQKIHSLINALKILNKNKYKKINVKFLTPDGKIKKAELKPNALGLYGFTLEEKIKKEFDFSDDYKFKSSVVYFLQDFFKWLIILSLLIGIVNFIPLIHVIPLDGGRIATLLLTPYLGFLKMSKEDTEKFIGRALSLLVYIILILNALPLFV